MEECDARGCRMGIAIVEDEKELVKAYQMIFGRKGIHICFIAYDGHEAVKKFVECSPRPHVILIDYRLPIMNGIDAMREIRKINVEVKFIFLSADVDQQEEAMRAGAYIFIKKPSSILTIVNAVRQAFGAGD
ncbi:response regulator [Methanocella sp. MCL-LM]|uniref:response regulator n=1 Tax=Methanocella sp. MCL-LM TaxID=3412035 RepID=UPI003C77F352